MKSSFFRIVCVGGAMTLLTSARANLTDYDPFNYSGLTLPGQNGGTGWNGARVTTSRSAVNRPSNDGISLSYPNTWESPLPPLTPSGSRVLTGGLSSIASTSRLLSQTIPLNVDGTVAYVSALFRKNTPNGTTNNDN